MTLTDREITDALALCEAATPGPWAYETPLPPAGATEVHWPVSLADDDVMPVCDYIRLEDARFIAAARTGWPKALEEVQRLRAQVADLEANAVRMRRYRFAMENIPTDSNGDPLCDRVIQPSLGNGRCGLRWNHEGDCA